MSDDERQVAWAEAMRRWLAEKTRKSAATAAAYETAWRKFHACCPAYPWLVTRADIVDFAQALQDAGFHNGTVNSYVSAVSGFYAYVVDIHEPPLTGAEGAPFTRNPARGIDWLDVDDKPAAWILKEHVDATLESIPPDSLENLRDLALIETLWRTAMRNTAVRSIRLVDFRKQGDDIWLRYKSKGKESRRVFPVSAWERVRVYLEARGRLTDLDNHLAGKRIDGDLYLFVNHSSNSFLWGDVERRPISREWLRDMTRKRYMAAVGIDYRPHSHRHGYAHWLDMQGYDLREISAYLDHSDIRMTLRYLESMRDKSGRLGNAA